MKHLVLAILMCIAALSAKAQVLTSETVKNGYETVVNMPASDYYTVSAHQRDTGHGNAPPLCRAVTVRPCVWLSCSHVRDSCSR
jgi:hypothetical protein